MAKGICYTQEFKRDAVAQVVDRDYSAIGDSLNIALRVEALTKTYDVDILVTKSIVTSASLLAFLEVDVVRAKGRWGWRGYMGFTRDAWPLMSRPKRQGNPIEH